MSLESDSQDASKSQHCDDGGCRNKDTSFIEKQTVDINTDGKELYDWKTKYEEKARIEMRFEAGYIAFILALSVTLLLINWLGVFSKILNLDAKKSAILEYLVFYAAAGMLGGIVFGMKYFYRVVARGRWTQDRRYWRIFSPFISMAIAFIVGCMVMAGMINIGSPLSYSWGVAFGFFAGYFADEAVGKMYDIAAFIFGKESKR